MLLIRAKISQKHSYFSILLDVIRLQGIVITYTAATRLFPNDGLWPYAVQPLHTSLDTGA